MAKTAAKVVSKIKLEVGDKFESLTSFSNYEGLGEANFQKLERGEVIEVEEITPELQLLIKGKKIIQK